MDRRAYNADIGTDWEHMTGPSPLTGGFSSWTNDYTSGPPTSIWGGSTQTPMDYSLTLGSGRNPVRQDYGPSYSAYTSSFDPINSYSGDLIFGRIQDYLDTNYPQYDEFGAPTNGGSGTGGGGNVSKNPGFAGGNFNKDPKVFGEIEAAAAKYGIPTNLLKSMIARESTGDWDRDGHRAPEVRPGDRILPYVGIFESTAKSWGYDFNAMIGNRALQIDAMAKGLNTLYQSVGAQYGWDGVISTYYSGKPDQSYTPPDSFQHGTTAEYVAQVKNMWTTEDMWTKANGGVLGATNGGGGMSSPVDPAWQGVNQWDGLVAKSAGDYGVPPNLIKAVMRLESGGVPTARSSQGATGLMQVMPFHDGGRSDRLLDPAFNIDMGTKILRNNYDQYGSWEMAAKAYLGLVGTDANGTDSSTYWGIVNGYWQDLNGSVSSGPGTSAPGAVMPISSVWGDLPGVSISSPHMVATDFVIQNTSTKYGGTYTGGRGMYDYAVEQFGQMGHPGVDYAMPIGTKLYSPVAGTVIANGGTGSYGDDHGGVGEIRIRMDNGHDLIFGHMGGSTVQVGSRIQPGMMVGTSGTMGTGPHLHLEYRVPDPRTPSGWASVDPAQLTTGGMVVGEGVGGGWANQGQQAPSRAMSYQDMIIANMRGRLGLGGTGTMSSGNGWNDWLYDTLYAGR